MSKWTKRILGGIATVVAAAGCVVASPIALPAIVVKVATSIVVYGTTAGVIAAKVLPGAKEKEKK